MLTNLQTRDVETLVHPYTNLDTFRSTGPLVLESGKGVWVYDSDGKAYIEGMAGLWCTALGYDNEEIVETARIQMSKMPYTHLFGAKSNDPAIELAEKLKEMAPMPVSKVFFGLSGSDANDTQVKLVWYYNNALGRPKKKKIIARLKGYHGVTVASASLTGLPNNHIDFDLPIANILHTSCPHHYRFGLEGESEEDFATRLANELEELILREGPDTVAAYIAEPVGGAGGVIVPPATYYEKIQAVLKRHDVLFIADEVICGFGRLGTPFGSTAMGMTPDTMSLAKAITSAYFPLSAVLIPEAIHQAMIDESRKIGVFGHGYTYSGHPVGAAIGVKTLEIYERDDVFGHAARMSPRFWKHLDALRDHPLVGEVRGKGLVAGLELVADKATKRAFEPRRGVGAKAMALAQEEGLILRAMGDTLALCPPLIIKEAEIDDLFDRFGRALNRAEELVRKDGLRD
ncbi:aspartate aminotransferase family protein [Alsobacter sp. SYSU M60028]|uniref:Aspartate aminotransferase family protein n=1 Tax=Alsobacter ponti TaxID=2962936 RepID=A0ABT1LC45_9HYPH|nr:aspartate aminotransferase family protein [Alsobacter ponti]MCP8939074.1 aspartate aminotransferase family protein [Alsobacter ponti]